LKNLYIWNDLELFYSLKTPELDNQLLSLLDNISSEVKSQYIVSGAFRNWITKELNQITNGSIVSIGTRPSLALEKCKHSSISFNRTIDDEGRSKGIGFKGDSENILTTICLSENEVHIFEDVLIGGNTLDFICDFINSLKNSSLKIFFHIFYGNRLSFNELKTKWTNFDFVLENTMGGIPILESTLICVYDLMYSSINNKPYVKNYDLMERFFRNKTLELEKLIKYNRRSFDERIKTIAQNARVSN
jgi:hypothetical protein